MGDQTPLSPDLSVGQYIIDKVNEWKEPLGLTGWALHLEHGPLDSKAACVAEPEYKRAVLSFDLDKLETGDELDEIIVHEMMHAPTWPIWEVAERLRDMAVGLAPEHMRDLLRAHWDEEIRYAGEDTNTQVGFTAIRLLRRLRVAQEELTNARTEIKSLRKQARQLDKVSSAG